MSCFEYHRRLRRHRSELADSRVARDNRVFPRLESLENRLAPAIFEFFDPNPGSENNFGETVRPLPNGNVVITSPGDDFAGTDAGAVYLFNGTTGTLISTLRGAGAGDRIGSGGVTVLTNGNYVVSSPEWNNGPQAGAGAVTFGRADIGVSGSVGPANSLTGSTAGDAVGTSVITLTNGHYLVRILTWDNGTVMNVGAVTWGNGVSGVSGAVSAGNSLIGSAGNDSVGTSVTALTNGNYVVGSSKWDSGATTDVGAATWGDGTVGVTGLVSPANSLVGSSTGDQISQGGIVALTNGNFVVSSPLWSSAGPSVSQVGAATFGIGTAPLTGAVSKANSFTGITASDRVSNGGIKPLTNGNYVVTSPVFDSGLVNNGNVTFCYGADGTIGASLIGASANDSIGSGGVVALTNGNYVVASPLWDNGAILNVGAVTWGNGSSGISGTVSSSNSLVGAQSNDSIGSGGAVALTNGNYVVISPAWDNGTTANPGAVTWGNGVGGTGGVVSVSNSLYGGASNDSIGVTGVVPLTNGNYVVRSSFFDSGTVINAGAVTWGNGIGGTTGLVSAANSLIGSTGSDFVGSSGVVALTNGNYVVVSQNWDNAGSVDAGAVTWGNGTVGTTGNIGATNSLIGTVGGESVGAAVGQFGLGNGVVALSDGNYAIASALFDNGPFVDAGALTWGNGVTGTVGTIAGNNSMYGLVNATNLLVPVVDSANGTFYGSFLREFNSGRVRIGQQATGFAAPRVAAVVVNDGATQRSAVTKVRVDFDQRVAFSGFAAGTAFELKRQSDGQLVTLAAAVANDTVTQVTLTFSGGPIDGISLADGRYTLTVLATKVTAGSLVLDGNGDGTGGDNYTLVGDPAVAPRLFRLFGDAVGNGSVTATDFNLFRLDYGSAGMSIFDFNGDGQVSAADFNQFRLRYGSIV